MSKANGVTVYPVLVTLKKGLLQLMSSQEIVEGYKLKFCNFPYRQNSVSS